MIYANFLLPTIFQIRESCSSIPLRHTTRERERESNVPRVALKDGSNAVVRSHIWMVPLEWPVNMKRLGL